MNKYKIEHKILTLAQCAVMDNRENPASFEMSGIKFNHWEFNYRDGWKTDAWIASGEIEAQRFIDALNIFRERLTKIVPRISVISQSYIEFVAEPFVVHKPSESFAFFKYAEDVESVGLMFMEKEKKALEELVSNNEIPEHFYHYWNDAVNATGYTAKLLLMFSAIEALVKENGKKNWNLIDEILGKELREKLFGTIEDSSKALRNRLVHGEYLDDRDNGTNYLESIHKAIIIHFNKKVLSEPLLEENVDQPQRHFFGNKQGGHFIIKRKDGGLVFSLKDLLDDFNEHGVTSPERYEHLFDNTLTTAY